MKVKSKFMQERMLLGKQQTIMYLTTFLIVPLIFIVVSIYGTIRDIVVPKDTTPISSIEEIEEFYNSEAYSIDVRFDEGININEIIQIETTEKEEMTVLGTRWRYGF